MFARFGSLAALILVACVLEPQDATAQSSWLTVTNCEMVNIDGHEYGKLTFDIHNLNFGQITQINLRPYHPDDPAEDAHIVQYTLPVGWNGFTGAGGSISWLVTSLDYAVEPGETLSGISIVLSEPTCCYALKFPGPLLGDPYPEFPVCFACPGVTPAGESTWGRIKETYR
jgi:hypothetical protein